MRWDMRDARTETGALVRSGEIGVIPKPLGADVQALEVEIAVHPVAVDVDALHPAVGDARH